MKPLIHCDWQDFDDASGHAEIWGNEKYTVTKRVKEPIDPANPRLIWLSIHTHDRNPLQDWRELQQIKNQLMGPEHEAVQLYPAESRLVDTANEMHLFAFDMPGWRFPFGWDERLVAEGTFTTGAVQRPFEPGERPADCKTPEELDAMAAGRTTA